MSRNVCHSQRFICTASLILMLGLAAGMVNADIRDGLVEKEEELSQVS